MGAEGRRPQQWRHITTHLKRIWYQIGLNPTELRLESNRTPQGSTILKQDRRRAWDKSVRGIFLYQESVKRNISRGFDVYDSLFETE